jgi:hypothetical protein
VVVEESEASADNHRISRLETEVAQLQTDVSYIRTSIDRQTHTIDNLATRFAENNRPQWSTYASWAGVVLILIGAYGAGYISVQDRHTLRIDQLAEAFRKHELSPGHPALVQGLVSTQESIKQLDSTLQREMRLLDGELDSRVTGLDDLLQREMRLMIATRDAVTERMDRRLEQLGQWQSQHDRTSAASAGAQDERLRALERTLQ